MTFKSESARYDDGMAAAPIFGELLRKHLDRRGVAPADFAKKLGFKSRTNVYNLFNAKRTPPPDRLEKMAEILDLSTDERLDFFIFAALAHVPHKGPFNLQEYLTKAVQRLRIIEKRFDAIEARLKGGKPGV